MRGLVQDIDNLVEVPPGYRKTFSFLTFTRIVCFFLLCNKRILLFILLILFLFSYGRIVFVEDLVFEGES